MQWFYLSGRKRKIDRNFWKFSINFFLFHYSIICNLRVSWNEDFAWFLFWNEKKFHVEIFKVFINTQNEIESLINVVDMMGIQNFTCAFDEWWSYWWFPLDDCLQLSDRLQKDHFYDQSIVLLHLDNSPEILSEN